jgi:hypothetical protein
MLPQLFSLDIWPFKYDSMCEHAFIDQKPCGNRQISTWIFHNTG